MSQKLTENYSIDPDWMVDIRQFKNGSSKSPTHVLVGRRGCFSLFCDGNSELPNLRPTRKKWRPVEIPSEAVFFQLPAFQVLESGVYYGNIRFFDRDGEQIETILISPTTHPLLAD